MTESTDAPAGAGGTGTPPAAAPVASAAGPPRRETLKLFLLGGAAAALTAAGATSAGCSPGGRPPNPGDRMIRWAASSIDRNPIDTRPVLIDEFERAHPSIEVALSPGPTDTDAKRDELRAAIEGEGDAPDVYLGDVIWPAEFGHAQLAMPLDGLWPLSASFWGNFDEARRDAASYEGRPYSVPFYANQGVLFYRKDLLMRHYGSADPPKTWEDLEAKAAHTTAREPGTPHGFVWQGDAYEGLTCVWTEFVADAGGRPDPPIPGGSSTPLRRCGHSPSCGG